MLLVGYSKPPSYHRTRTLVSARFRRETLEGGKMARPLVLIHGYSAEGTAFDPLRDALKRKGVNATDINICTYVSLNNEITIKDIAEGLDRALRNHKVLRDESRDFDAIVHSTGMLVLRSWLTNYGRPWAPTSGCRA